MVWFQSRVWLSTLAVSLAYAAMGGGLGDLKKKTDAKAEAQKPKDPPPESKSYSSAATSSFGSGTFPSENTGSGAGFMSDFWGWMVAGPFAYRSDDPSASLAAGEEGWAEESSGGLMRMRHQRGQAVLPYVRADLNWQHIDQNNEAIDGRIELGYKLFGFQARTTKYTDRLEDYTQRVNQYYGMLRYGGEWPDVFPGAFEVAFGVGMAHQQGDLSDDSAAAITLPLKYYPADWVGVEFRPAWYEADYGGLDYNIGDYDFSASLGSRYVQVRAGYRWLWFSGVGKTLNGPYAGLSLSF